jgi:hypothetical protein
VAGCGSTSVCNLCIRCGIPWLQSAMLLHATQTCTSTSDQLSFPCCTRHDCLRPDALPISPCLHMCTCAEPIPAIAAIRGRAGPLFTRSRTHDVLSSMMIGLLLCMCIASVVGEYLLQKQPVSIHVVLVPKPKPISMTYKCKTSFRYWTGGSAVPHPRMHAADRSAEWRRVACCCNACTG